MTENDPNHDGIVAWGWHCTGMKGMALGHLKPTPTNTYKFYERNTQVFPLVVKPETDALSTATDQELVEAMARRFIARNPQTGLTVHADELVLCDDRFNLSFRFDSEGCLVPHSDLRIGRHTHD